MERKIDNIDELKSFLTRAYWIESQFENSMLWMGYIEVKDNELKDILFQMTRDSENHKNTLKNMHTSS